MSDAVSHPVFARLFDRLAAKAEAAGQAIREIARAGGADKKLVRARLRGR